MSVWVKRLLKFLHEVGTVGLMGAVSVNLILSYAADGLPPDELATMRYAMLLVSDWLLLPSLLVVLTSGLLALAATKAFHDAGWAWIKAALTILVLEGTLFAVSGPAKTAAAVSAEMAAGDLSHAKAFPNILRHERGGLGVILFLSVANIALAVWRPKLRRRKLRASERAQAAVSAAATPDVTPLEGRPTEPDQAPVAAARQT